MILFIRSSISADDIDLLRINLVKYYGVSYYITNINGSYSSNISCGLRSSMMDNSSLTSLTMRIGNDGNDTSDKGNLFWVSDCSL
jgi:beta-glucosidase/6-phospho-beta-glucosidase/beta-galactosidase